MIQETIIKVPVGADAAIEGNLTLMSNAAMIVLFAHGSGSSRFSPRNQFVAKEFNKAGLATLLLDLLTVEEEEVDVVTAEYRFNIDLLAQRLISATQWIRNDSATRNLSIGFFGASTGAAAALIAAAKMSQDVVAVVSRGGRPDMAFDYLADVKAPTLLLVGGLDTEVIELNKQALEQLSAEKKLVIIPDATHLFEEPGKLEQVARYSTDWFIKHSKL